MSKLINILLLIPGVIHLLPVYGLLGSDVISRLYGIEVNNPNAAILLQHRAVLFGLLGGGIILSIFVPILRTYICVATLISAISFVVIAFIVGGYNAEINNILRADYLSIICLILALVLEKTTSRL